MEGRGAQSTCWGSGRSAMVQDFGELSLLVVSNSLWSSSRACCRSMGWDLSAGLSQESSFKFCMAWDWPATGQRLLFGAALVGVLGRGLQVWALLEPVPWYWYTVQLWAAVRCVEVTCFWYESSWGNKILLLQNLMGIYMKKYWTWIIETAFCAANYWVIFYNLSKKL